jgi:hypothetical protein
MMANLHRNNAAEWVMVVTIAPLVWLMRGIGFLSARLRG